MSTRPTIVLATCLALLAGLVLLPGCIKSSEETKVAKEGSGTSVITMILDMSKLKALQDMMEGMGMGGEGGMAEDPMEDLEPEKLKEKLGEAKGVKIVKVERAVDEEKMTTTVTVEIAFDSLQALYESGAVESVDVELEKLPDGNYRYTRTAISDMAPDTSDDPESQQMMEAMLAMFQPYMADMEIAATLTLPTTILETNGKKLSEYQVTWKVGFEDLTKADKRTQTVTFLGAGLDWKPFATKGSSEDVEVEAPEEEEEEEEVEAPMR